MVATIPQLIGKINPRLYAKNWEKLLKKYGTPDNIPAEEVEPQPVMYDVKFHEAPSTVQANVFNLNPERGMPAAHRLVYDSSSETLEPLYFFILDLMKDNDLSVEKLIDNFSPTPGSGHFGELSQRATIMQQQGTKLLGDVNTVLRSVLNIIYDLKEFRIRIQHYNDYNSKGDETSGAALLALKQVWMDKVDISKGNSSIKAMALGQAGYQTLIDAFLAAEDEKDVRKLDLNKRVKRILLPRLNEFKLWLRESERELKKRYELEKTYLKSQVNSLKLYARWAKPYLLAAKELERTDMGREPALVKIFNTIVLELTLLGKSKPIDPKQAAIQGELPRDFEKLAMKREYLSCVLVDFRFRGIPQKVGQHTHYAFGGRSEVSFTAYSLNKEELEKLDELLEDESIADIMALIEGVTTESLGELQDEINFFLEEETPEKASQKGGSNPFLALIGAYNKKPEPVKKQKSKTEKKPKIGPIRKDDFLEREHLRPFAAAAATNTIYNLFNIYKKAHGMPSYD